MAKTLGIDLDKIPNLHEPHEIIGKVTLKASKKTCLKTAISVVTDGLDAACCTLRAGVIEDYQTKEQGGQAGEMEAEAVAKEIGYEGNVVILEGPIGQSAQIDRGEGNMNVLNEYPDIEVLEMKTANWSRAEAISLMENWLTNHGNNIDGVIGQNDEMALDAIQAIKLFGFDLDDFAIAGIVGVTDAMMAVKEGEHDLSILQDAKAQAQGALNLALRAVIGEDYSPKAAAWDKYEDLKWGDELKEVYNVPCTPLLL